MKVGAAVRPFRTRPKKEAPRRALVMKQVAGQVGVNGPADSINAAGRYHSGDCASPFATGLFS